MPQVTIKDLARSLNLSPSTVSRALRNHPDISLETKMRVVSLAARFDYRPNLIAQSLQTQRTNTIGVIVPEIRHYFFSTVISGIEEVAYESGYIIMVCQSNENYDREVINTKALISHRVAGLLISVSQDTRKVDHLKSVIHQGIPLVFFDRAVDELRVSKVVVDDYQGAYTATGHLVRAGYTRIAHLAGPRHVSISRNRCQGYKQALRDHGLPVDEDLIVHGGFNEIDGQAGLRQLLTLARPPEAVFAVNDPVAFGVYKGLKEIGLRIPDDLALIGFSNNPVSAMIEPPLNTMEQPAFEIGRAAAALLLEQIRAGDDEFVPTVKLFQTRLIVRQSA